VNRVAVFDMRLRQAGWKGLNGGFKRLVERRIVSQAGLSDVVCLGCLLGGRFRLRIFGSYPLMENLSRPRFFNTLKEISTGVPSMQVRHLRRYISISLLQVDTNANEKKLCKIYEELGFSLVRIVAEDYRFNVFLSEEMLVGVSLILVVLEELLGSNMLH
jgi:hypothetical protein